MDGDGTWGHGGWLRVPALACNAMCVPPSASTNHALHATRQNNHRTEQGSRAAGQRVERGRGR